MLPFKNIFLILLMGISTKLSSNQDWSTPLYGLFQTKSSTILSSNNSPESLQDTKDHIIELLDATLQIQEYWKQLQQSPLKRIFATNPLHTIKKLFSEANDKQDEINSTIKDLKEVQILLALALTHYEAGSLLSPEEEEFFFEQIKQILENQNRPSFFTRHWAPILAFSAATYGASKSDAIVSAFITLKDNSAKFINTLKEFKNNDMEPLPIKRIPTFQELRTLLYNYYEDSKEQYLDAKETYKSALCTNVQEILHATPNNLQEKTISELQQVRDNYFAQHLPNPFENKLVHFGTDIFRKVTLPSWWQHVRGGAYIYHEQADLSALDQSYLDSVVTQAHYYKETGRATGKALIAGYIIYKITKLVKNALKSGFHIVHGIATKRPSLTEFKKNLTYCQRLLNHARTETSSTYYSGMLLYFIEKFKESRSKISSNWKQRFDDDLEDLKNSHLSFDQKYETVKAMIRDYSFLND